MSKKWQAQAESLVSSADLILSSVKQILPALQNPSVDSIPAALNACNTLIDLAAILGKTAKVLYK